MGKQCYNVTCRLEDMATLESDPSAMAGPMDGQGQTALPPQMTCYAAALKR